MCSAATVVRLRSSRREGARQAGPGAEVFCGRLRRLGSAPPTGLRREAKGPPTGSDRGLAGRWRR